MWHVCFSYACKYTRMQFHVSAAHHSVFFFVHFKPNVNALYTYIYIYILSDKKKGQHFSYCHIDWTASDSIKLLVTRNQRKQAKLNGANKGQLLRAIISDTNRRNNSPEIWNLIRTVHDHNSQSEET